MDWYKESMNEKLSTVLQNGQTIKTASLGILTDALHRISDIENWCQKHDAQNMKGRAVSPDHEDACRWCLGGSLVLSMWDYADICKAEAILDRKKDIGLTSTESDRVNATIMGAFSVVLGRDDYALVRKMPEYTCPSVSPSFSVIMPLIARVNDNYGHSTALMLLRDVIEYIESES